MRLAWLADRVRLVYIKGGDAGKAPLRLTATGADGAEAVVHDFLVVNETAPCAPARRDWQRLTGLSSRCFCLGLQVHVQRAAQRDARRVGAADVPRPAGGRRHGQVLPDQRGVAAQGGGLRLVHTVVPSQQPLATMHQQSRFTPALSLLAPP